MEDIVIRSQMFHSEIFRLSIDEYEEKDGKEGVIFQKELKKVLGKLSKRQTEIVMNIFFGKSIMSIASDLGISASTVATHKTIAFDKLGIKTVAQLIDIYYEDLNVLK